MSNDAEQTIFEASYGANHQWTHMAGGSGVEIDVFHTEGGELLVEYGCETPSCVWPRPLQEYVWLAGEPIAVVTSELPERAVPDDTNGELYFVHTGLLGEPRRATKGDKTSAWEIDVPPFGRTDDQVAGPSGSPEVFISLGYPGQYFQEGSGDWHFNWHRTYWAGYGRYAQADPLLTPSHQVLSPALIAMEPAPLASPNMEHVDGFAGEHSADHVILDIAPYSYAASLPLSHIDWSGLAPDAPACEDDDEGCNQRDCLKSCGRGAKARERYCRTLPTRRLRGLCWGTVFVSSVACQGWCYWNCD